MAQDYSVEIIDQIAAKFEALGLHRPMRIGHYDAGTPLEYAITPIEPGQTAQVKLEIEKFVGGGFAGQVYRVRVVDILRDGEPLESVGGIAKNSLYAMKILIPPSNFSLLFRNLLYAVGFQGPFQLQVNPTAARAGALWQKFIRKAAQARFGDEKSVNNVHATFIDHTLGSCGEISDWVDGRTWRLEVDDRMDRLKCWQKGKPIDESLLGSPEYRAKHGFMHDFVAMLHEMGAHEFARQYEWSTCKSQPNCLKRTETDAEPEKGLIAVDFRAGLTLLPVLPMSPGDFKLIWQGLKRGSLVQFDRGDISKLRQYVDAHPDVFAELPDKEQMLRDLEECEDLYRDSVPDITHNGLRLLYDRWLWSTIFSSAVSGWKVRNLIDDKTEQSLRKSPFKTFVFFLIGICPLLGRMLRKSWGRPDWRKHYGAMFTNIGYFFRAARGRIFEKLITWERADRLPDKQILGIAEKPLTYYLHLPLSFLPIGIHRFIVDGEFRREKLFYIFVRPFKLYFSASMREQWMRDMVAEGQKKHILSDEDAELILSRIKEPYIQRYLLTMVLHLLTLPVTQIVSLSHIGIWNYLHPEATTAERAAVSLAIGVIYQIIPISPGSFARGLITTAVAIYDRTFKEYNLALFISYFKYIGYLAFPIQMTYRYPVLARFMAAHWATDAVHIVPVFGERGALLEHAIFDMFYNWPLTIRGRMARISEWRKNIPARMRHFGLLGLLAGALMAGSHVLYMMNHIDVIPARGNFWLLKPLILLVMLVPVTSGGIGTCFAGGLARTKRLLLSALSGVLAAVVYTIGAYYYETQSGLEEAGFLFPLVWRSFAFAIFGLIGAIISEVKTQDPDLKALEAIS